METTEETEIRMMKMMERVFERILLRREEAWRLEHDERMKHLTVQKLLARAIEEKREFFTFYRVDITGMEQVDLWNDPCAQRFNQDLPQEIPLEEAHGFLGAISGMVVYVVDENIPKWRPNPRALMKR